MFLCLLHLLSRQTLSLHNAELNLFLIILFFKTKNQAFSSHKKGISYSQKYMDGGLTDNLPKFDTGRTITVSPFDGKTDICPKKGQELDQEKKGHFIALHNQEIQVDMSQIQEKHKPNSVHRIDVYVIYLAFLKGVNYVKFS